MKQQRQQKDYLNMTHSILVNHFQTETKRSAHKTKLEQITDFLGKNGRAWIYYYLINRFGPNHPYQSYQGAHTGVYPLGPGPASIAIAADWATDTQESTDVAIEMGKHLPDYTIHLGDTYFVGAPHEIDVNFTRKDSPWFRGSKGSFAILGNHEMYARGIAFFKTLLPTLGLNLGNGKFSGQHAGYFCLESSHWLILGLDTGYHSIGKIPIIEMIPGFGPDCHFDKKLITWLREVLKTQDPNHEKGLLILTHHQYMTAFKTQDEFLTPAGQLAELVGTDRKLLWIWGHEHKFSVFESAKFGKGVFAYGRCIGHGGMPVELDDDSFKRDPGKHGDQKLVMVDKRLRTGQDGVRLGFNGYVKITVEEEKLKVSYCDVNEKLLTEAWTVTSGSVAGKITYHSPKLQTVYGKTWQDAIK